MSDDVTAVQHLLARLAHAMDSAPSPDDLLGLLAPDIEWAPPGAEPVRGIAAMREWVERRRQSGNQGPGSGIRHLVSSIAVEIEDGGERGRVRAHFAMVATTAEGPVVRAVGSYEDEVVAADGRWLLRRRLITL